MDVCDFVTNNETGVLRARFCYVRRELRRFGYTLEGPHDAIALAKHMGFTERHGSKPANIVIPSVTGILHHRGFQIVPNPRFGRVRTTIVDAEDVVCRGIVECGALAEIRTPSSVALVMYRKQDVRRAQALMRACGYGVFVGGNTCLPGLLVANRGHIAIVVDEASYESAFYFSQTGADVTICVIAGDKPCVT
jgi:hypothetical protein